MAWLALKFHSESPDRLLQNWRMVRLDHYLASILENKLANTNFLRIGKFPENRRRFQCFLEIENTLVLSEVN